VQSVLLLFLLLMAGMLLVNGVSMQLAKQQALRRELEHGRELLALLSGRLAVGDGPVRLESAGLGEAVLCLGVGGASGETLSLSPGCEAFAQPLERALTAAVRRGEESGRLLALPSGAALRNPPLLVAGPVRFADGVAGGLALLCSTEGLHARLWDSQRAILGYILVNGLLLTAIGFFRLRTLVVRPLERLAEQAESSPLQAGYLPFPERAGNEFGRLSASLNRMLAQIEEDRAALRQKVESLRSANAELERNRREMLRTEKMASIGRLAAGLAHEIGNPLGVVQGYLGLLGQEASPEERREFARRAEQEVARVGKLLRQLLDYARPAQTAPALLRVGAALAEALELIRQGAPGRKLALALRQEAREDLVLADADGLRQVLVNCLLNAVDAVAARPDGRVTARCLDAEEAGGRSVRVVIEDNGPGIAEEHLESVFEPFFTTKEPGRGTGLGLAVSLALVEKWGGRMWAEGGRKGRGAAIWISLPLAEPGPEKAKEHEERADG